MAGINFYAPFVSARIITKNGDVYPMWNFSSGGKQIPGLTSLAFLESAEIAVSTSNPYPDISLTLTPPYRDGKALLESELLNWGESSLEVQIGYSSATGQAVVSVPFLARLQQPEVNVGADYSITLKGQGIAADEVQNTRMGGTYNDMTRQEIIKAVLSGPPEATGMPQVTVATTSRRKIRVDDSAVFNGTRIDPTSNLSGDSLVASAYNYITATIRENVPKVIQSAVKLYSEERISITGAFYSPWALAFKLLMEAKCRAICIGDVVKIFPVDGWMRSAPVRILRFYDFPTRGFVANYDAVGDLPLLTVQCDALKLLMPQESVLMRGVNSETREAESELISDSETQETRVRTRGLTQFMSEVDNSAGLSSTGDGGGYYPGTPSNPTARANAVARHNEDTQLRNGLHMTATTLLDPGLFPGMTVEVRGISNKHDGNFAIQGATYTMGSGGAEMSLDLLANITLSTIAAGNYDDASTPHGEENTSTVDESASDPAVPEASPGDLE